MASLKEKMRFFDRMHNCSGKALLLAFRFIRRANVTRQLREYGERLNEMTRSGTLFPLGYAHPVAAAQIAEIMRDGNTLLVDIRDSPRSRWRPAWNRYALAAAYGKRYLWEPRLGNSNYRYREAGIQLADGCLDAIRVLVVLLRHGTNLILLCACKDEQACHRRLVAKLIQDALGEQAEEVLA